MNIWMKVTVMMWMLCLILCEHRILNTTLFESWEIVGPYPSWWVFNGLLVLLQGLHIFWSYLIVKIACKAISKGKVRDCSLHRLPSCMICSACSNNDYSHWIYYLISCWLSHLCFIDLIFYLFTGKNCLIRVRINGLYDKETYYTCMFNLC